MHILSKTKDANGHWKAYGVVTSRRVQADGYTYYSAPVRGWRAFRARYAGDATHESGLSSPVGALRRYISEPAPGILRRAFAARFMAAGAFPRRAAPLSFPE